MCVDFICCVLLCFVYFVSLLIDVKCMYFVKNFEIIFFGNEMVICKLVC